MLVGSCLHPGGRQRWTALREWLHVSEGTILMFYTKLSVLVTTFQTISLLSSNHANIENAKSLPPVLRAVVDVFQFLSFDIGMAIPGLDCLVKRFSGKLMFQTIGFIVISLLFLAAYARAKANQDANAHMHLCHLVDFVKLVLPAITRLQFQAITCKTYEGRGKAVSVLLVDHAMDCSSSAFASMRAFATVNTVVPLHRDTRAHHSSYHDTHPPSLVPPRHHRP